ncbi:sulfite exporter TauE/SafE family protein [Thermococcus sp. 21S9]|uniref:sulfite exporter TauE/SafE family protein n=1 Tax=Thermococcus sp. 21S9 TaxID=1638223 RepID=UPI00143CB63D|nr:sulfite exporter TauE/SafE family protein [Thermococcus sp. 21S9]NJE55375.1 sulfite exporter TauE/SafE family protein [Thermococcus sp. 21S9]
MSNYALYFAVGVTVGIVSALFGLGGGFVLVPVLNLLGVSIHQAVGTSSAAVVFTALSSTIAYSRRGMIHYKTGVLLSIPAIVGAYLGAVMTTYVTPGELKVIFGVTLLFVAYRMYTKETAELGDLTVSEVKIDYRLVPIGGFFSGIASGLLGVGGGIINVPFLVWLGMPMHYAVATSSFAIVFTSASSALKHYMMGNVELHWLVLLVPGLIIGAQLGARLAERVKASSLKRAFAIVMVILALRMIVSGLR